MKSLPTQERAIKKRIALLKAAAHEFEQSGFEVSTAKSIAAKAGVATGTFYQYFENKNDILRVIAETRFFELHQQVGLLESEGLSVMNDAQADTSLTHARSLFKQVLAFLYEYHLQDALLHQVLDQRRGLDPKLDDIMTRGEDLMRSHVVDFISDFELDDSEIVADSLFAMGEGLVHRMVFGKTPENPDKMLEIGAAMLASYFAQNPALANGSKESL